ncbi:hypothetical protein JKP88DRAFT_245395 [Tribonema minus]|uniref:Uncharacterized protein n=1 Tax=Tribonema minus TaxID=303371 RepID=A0A835YZ84_9STRA|nr:hypothetical protein JKP88DRAFT_245395 [Tribonema minus]
MDGWFNSDNTECASPEGDCIAKKLHQVCNTGDRREHRLHSDAATAFFGDDDSSRFHEAQLLDELVPANVDRIYSSKLFRVQVVAPAKCVKARVSTTVTVTPPDIDIGTVVLGVNGERYAIWSAVVHSKLQARINIWGFMLRLEFAICTCSHCEAHPGRIFRTANGSDLAWEEVTGCKTDISAGIATAEVRRFSSYAYGINLEEHKGMRVHAIPQIAIALGLPLPSSFELSMKATGTPGMSKYAVNAFTNTSFGLVIEPRMVTTTMGNDDTRGMQSAPAVSGSGVMTVSVGSVGHTTAHHADLEQQQQMVVKASGTMMMTARHASCHTIALVEMGGRPRAATPRAATPKNTTLRPARRLVRNLRCFCFRCRLGLHSGGIRCRHIGAITSATLATALCRALKRMDL